MLITDFFPAIRLLVPVALDETLESVVKDTVSQFFSTTLAWKETTEVSLFFGSGVYELDLPQGTRVVRLESVDSEGGRFLAVTSNEAKRALSTKNNSANMYNYHNGELTVIVANDAIKVVNALVTVSSTNAITSLPDNIAYKHKDAITAGATARMFSIPMTDWYNLNIANTFEQKYAVLEKRAYAARNDTDDGTNVIRSVKYGGY